MSTNIDIASFCYWGSSENAPINLVSVKGLKHAWSADLPEKREGRVFIMKLGLMKLKAQIR